MMNLRILCISLLLAVMLPVAGCSDEGGAEKAGKELDKALDSAGDALKNVTD